MPAIRSLSGHSVDRFVYEVRRVAMACPPFSAGALDNEKFGPNANIPVTEVTVVPQLRWLHDELCEAVRGLGGEAVEPAYWGAGCRAHVTKTQRGSTVDPGDEVRLDRLALIDCTAPVCKVVWVEPLDSTVR